MPTFVYMTRCDGCGECVDICPSDIMHIDKTYRRAYNIEPNFCWECYSCVKACPQHAIDVRGYSDFAPLGHSVRVGGMVVDGSVRREEVPVERWLSGARGAVVTIPPGRPVRSVEIDPDGVYPDVDRTNNRWVR